MCQGDAPRWGIVTASNGEPHSVPHTPPVKMNAGSLRGVWCGGTGVCGAEVVCGGCAILLLGIGFPGLCLGSIVGVVFPLVCLVLLC